MNRTVRCILAAAAVFAAASIVAAHAGSDNEDGQRPPVGRVEELPTVREEAQPAPPKECLTDKSGFRNRDGQNEFYVELINVCDKPLVCVVKAYVIGSEGGKAGSGTLQLAAALNGVDVRETWAMATAQNGGMASVSRSCTFK